MTFRIPAYPVQRAIELLAAADGAGYAETWLRDDPIALAAIAVASPPLGEDLERCLATGAGMPDRTVSAVIGYLQRMATRATPFGLLAGVALVADGGDGPLGVSARESASIRARFDSEWTNGLARMLIGDERRRRGMSFYANDTVYESGDRFIVPASSAANATFKATRATRFILAESAAARRYDELATLLRTRFQATAAQANGMLDQLIRAGALRPALDVSPIDDLAAEIGRTLDRDDDIASEILAASGAMESLASAPSLTQALERYRSTEDRLSALGVPSRAILQLDSVRGVTGSLPPSVFADAAELAGMHFRHARQHALVGARQRFLARYGPDELVPLTAVADPRSEIVEPAELELIGADDRSARSVQAAAILQAHLAGSQEIMLNDTDIPRWFPGRAAETAVPGSCEIGFSILADDAQSVACGAYRLQPSPFLARAPGGAIIGRFVHAFDPSARATLRDLLARHDDPGTTVRATLIVRPADPRLANVAAHRQTSEYAIEVGYASASTVNRIGLNDLFVGVDSERFFLYSRALGKRVELDRSSMLDAGSASSPVGAFLTLVAQDGYAPPLLSFRHDLPVLPRVIYHRLVLSPLQWTLTAGFFCDNAAALSARIEQHWERWSLPRYGTYAEFDRELLIDFRSPTSLAILRRVLRGHDPAAPVRFTDAERILRSGWLRGPDGAYAAELVATLERVRAGARVPSPIAFEPAPRSLRTHGLGSDLVQVHLGCARHEVDDVLRRVMAPLIAALRAADLLCAWCFERTASPEALRVYVRVSHDWRVEARDRVYEAFDAAATSGVTRPAIASSARPPWYRYAPPGTSALVERILTISSDGALETAASTGTQGECYVPACAAAGPLYFALRAREASAKPHPGKRAQSFWNIVNAVAERLREDGAGPLPALVAKLEAMLPAGESDAASVRRMWTGLLAAHFNHFGLAADAQPRPVDVLAEAVRSNALRRPPPANPG